MTNGSTAVEVLTVPQREGSHPVSVGLMVRSVLTPFVLAIVFLWSTGPEPTLHFDTLVDYLLARDCHDLDVCGTHHTSVPGLSQGPLLPRMLATLDRAGLSPTAHHWVFMALGAAGATIVFSAVRHLKSEGEAAIAGVTALVLGAV